MVGAVHNSAWQDRSVAVIYVPYHLDEHLPELNAPLLVNVACTWHPGREDTSGVRERLPSLLLTGG